MAFSTLDRKVALLKSGINQRMVADACGVDFTLVSHVIAGRRWLGTDARRVMMYIARKTGVPVKEFFPGYNLRKRRPRGQRTELVA